MKNPLCYYQYGIGIVLSLETIDKKTRATGEPLGVKKKA